MQCWSLKRIKDLAKTSNDNLVYVDLLTNNQKLNFKNLLIPHNTKKLEKIGKTQNVIHN